MGRPGQFSEKYRTLEAWDVQDSFLKSIAPWKHGTSWIVFWKVSHLVGVGRPRQFSEKHRTLVSWDVQDGILKSVAPWKHGTSATDFWKASYLGGVGRPGQYPEMSHLEDVGRPAVFWKGSHLVSVGRPGQYFEKRRIMEPWDVRDSFLKRVTPWRHARATNGTMPVYFTSVTITFKTYNILQW